jgi:hypothetical protein
MLGDGREGGVEAVGCGLMYAGIHATIIT